MSKKILLIASVLALCSVWAVAAKDYDAWDGGTIYKFDDGADTVTFGEFNGKKQIWVNKWWIGPESNDTPGGLVDSGGTSGWAFVNTMDAAVAYKWEGCTQSPSSDAQVCLPTFQDAAKGAYTMIHDDICAMDYDTHVKKGLEIAQKYGIRLAWGVFVGECEKKEYEQMRNLVANGHEMVNHSMNHNSAAATWQWFYHGDKIPDTAKDPSIPPEFANLTIDTTIGDGNGKVEGDKVGWNSKGWNEDTKTNVKMYKLFCRPSWTESDFDLNCKESKEVIDENVYAHKDLKTKFFPKEKRTEYYVYPYDAFSEYTHKRLDEYGYVAARGGSKSGKPIPGDFYHPFRIDFDAYFDDDMPTEENPHQLLKVDDMVDLIVKENGYMIREFHAVSEKEEWWGAVTPSIFERHLKKVKGMVDKGDLCVLTPSEAVKQRITTNACSNPSVKKGRGDEWVISMGNKESIKEKYQDEISVIFTFPSSFDDSDWKGVASQYVGRADAPLLQPKRLGKNRWSVYFNPYKGDVKIFESTTSIKDAKSIAHSNAKFVSFNKGKVAMYLGKGEFNAVLYNIKGQAVSSIKGIANGGLLRTNLNVNNLANGQYILKVFHSNGVLRNRVVLVD